MYDPTMEQDARVWIEQVLGEELVKGADPKQPLGEKKFHSVLKDGLVLCRLMNALQPGSVEKMSKERSRIAMMENISKFLEACKAYGLQNGDLFHPTDLFDGSSMSKVVYTVQVLGKTAQTKGFKGPALGGKDPHMASFSQDQLLNRDTFSMDDFARMGANH